MQRRDFLKTSALSSGLFLNNNLFNKSTDIDLIIDAVEKQASISYKKPKVFKLYDFQKEIIKNIYENEKVIIIKSRQIGMSTILRAIAEINEKQFVNSLKYHFDLKYYFGLRRNFTSVFSRNRRSINKIMCVMDEKISAIQQYKVLPSFKTEGIHIQYVIAGGSTGQMKWAYDNAEKYGYKVFVYPYYKTTPSIERSSLDFKKHLSKEHWQQEFECKFF